jgi:hypothetical protein
MTTDQKGAIAETAIALAAIKLGIGVFRPIEDERCDLIFDRRPELCRVQCKWATRYDDVVVVRCNSNRRAREGLVRRLYTADEIEAFAAYCYELDRCFFLPIERFPRNEIRLRLHPARNNQRRGITWADDFDFAVTLGNQQGAVAQLGERRHGMAEATGSSPVGSIPKPSSLGARKSPGLGASRGWSAHLSTRTSTDPSLRRGCPESERNRTGSPLKSPQGSS